MSIVSISRGSYYRGSEVAHKVADLLGICLAFHGIRSWSPARITISLKSRSCIISSMPCRPLERLSFGRERYIHFISSAILRHLKKDNHVYHGLAGQFFLHDVSHVVKVRIIADMEERVLAEAAIGHIFLRRRPACS